MAARAGRAPTDFLPRRLYRYDVHLAGLLDLRTADARAAVELSDDDLLGDDPTPSQAVGEAAQYLGREGVIVMEGPRCLRARLRHLDPRGSWLCRR